MKKRSAYIEGAKFRIQNRKWIHYSNSIALRVLASIDDIEGMSQKKLAEKLGVSPQYINKVVQGNENLSLETIAKLSDALGVELITFPHYRDDEALKPKVPVRPPKKGGK